MINPMMSSELIRRIVISGSICEQTGAQFVEQISMFEHISLDPITVFITSYGGDLYSALMMVDLMKSSPCPITTISAGKCMSAATLLQAAGDKGSRYITKNTRVMIHNVSSGLMGDVGSLNTEMDELNINQESYINLLSEYTGQSKAKIREDMAKTTYMSANAAVKYGIADKVVPYKKLVNPKVSKKAISAAATKKKK